MRRVLLLLGLAVLAAPSLARASWTPDGVSFSVGPYPFYARVAGDGQGGAYVCWGTGNQVLVSHLDAQGDLVPGWSISGQQVNPDPGVNVPAMLAPDGAGGVYVVWFYENCFAHCSFDPAQLRVQHLTFGGGRAPGWTAAGVMANAQLLNYRSFCQDTCGAALAWCVEAGDLMLAWERHFGIDDGDIHAQRVTFGGQAAWGDTGLVVTSSTGRQWAPSVAGDGAGGLYVAWRDARTASGIDLRAQHLSSAGVRQWPTLGILLSADAGIGHALAPLAVRDGSGGLIAVWPELLGTDISLFATRITAGKAFLWSSTPVCVLEGFRSSPAGFADGVGGALLAWRDSRGGTYGTRLDADGTPRWGDQGTPLVGPASWNPLIAPDGAHGMYLVWSDDHLGESDLIGLHVGDDGAPSPGWPADGKRLSTQFPTEDLALAPDGAGGAVAAWIAGGIVSQPLPWAQRMAADGPVPVRVAVTRAEVIGRDVALAWSLDRPGAATIERCDDGATWSARADVVSDGRGVVAWTDAGVPPGHHGWRLALPDGAAGEVWRDVAAPRLALLGTRPQPADARLVVALELPGDAPAALELCDVAGRRRRRQTLTGAGRHTIALGDASLAPGIYVVTLTQGAQRVVLRVPVLR